MACWGTPELRLFLPCILVLKLQEHLSKLRHPCQPGLRSSAWHMPTLHVCSGHGLEFLYQSLWPGHLTLSSCNSMFLQVKGPHRHRRLNQLQPGDPRHVQVPDAPGPGHAHRLGQHARPLAQPRKARAQLQVAGLGLLGLLTGFQRQFGAFPKHLKPAAKPMASTASKQCL